MENSNSKSKILENQPSEIRVFQEIKKNFVTFGISPGLITQTYPFNERILLHFSIHIFAAFTTFAFIVDGAKHFIEYTQSIYMFSLSMLIIETMANVIFKAEELFDLMDGAASIANTKLKYSASKSFYFETSQQIEQLSKIIYILMGAVTPISGILPWIVYIYLIYFTTDSGSDAFELPQTIWLPFNYKTPFGFLFAVLIEFSMLTHALAFAACLIALGIGSFFIAMATSRCIKGSLYSISQIPEPKANVKLLLEQIIEFIKLHTHVKQLVGKFSYIFQPMLATLFLWSLVTICGALLIMQIELANHDDNLMVLSMTLLEVIYAFGVMLAACELGQRMQQAFIECSDIIYQMDWYNYPIEIQQILPIILNFTQQPIDIECFGSTSCVRETFKFVVNKSYSYFTVLRQFYN